MCQSYNIQIDFFLFPDSEFIFVLRSVSKPAFNLREELTNKIFFLTNYQYIESYRL
jgi:hypothetical protein